MKSPFLFRRLFGAKPAAPEGAASRSALARARRTAGLSRALVSERGEVSGALRAREALEAYRSLDAEARAAFFDLLVEEFSPDPETVWHAAERYHREASQANLIWPLAAGRAFARARAPGLARSCSTIRRARASARAACCVLSAACQVGAGAARPGRPLPLAQRCAAGAAQLAGRQIGRRHPALVRNDGELRLSIGRSGAQPRGLCSQRQHRRLEEPSAAGEAVAAGAGKQAAVSAQECGRCRATRHRPAATGAVTSARSAVSFPPQQIRFSGLVPTRACVRAAAWSRMAVMVAVASLQFPVCP